MPAFELLELMLLSGTNRAAKRVKFNPHRTIILGGNDTGKSSILKSIYETFGASAAVVHPDWRQLNVTSVVRFRLHGREYTILRQGRFHAVFDHQQHVLGTFDSITHGLGPFLGELFGFQLRLNDREGEIITPPPAYFFLPFYIDQDAGWNKNLASFARLQQLPNWKKSVVEYHIGLKPDEYYRLRSEAEVKKEQIRASAAELRVLRSIVSTVREEIGAPGVDVDLEAFRTQIQELLEEVGKLQVVEERLRSELVALQSRRSSVQSQLEIARAAWKEVRADYVFATEELEEPVLHCPICGAGYENSFVERFHIAEDENQIAELIVSLEAELAEIDRQVAQSDTEFVANQEQITRLNELLESRQKDVTLAEVVQSEGRKEVYTLFRTKISEAEQKILDEEIDRERLVRQMDKFTKREDRSS